LNVDLLPVFGNLERLELRPEKLSIEKMIFARSEPISGQHLPNGSFSGT
jgi:hypothetical protein